MQVISASDLRKALHDGQEIALFDVREDGQIGEGHILFSAPLSYSRFERDLPRRAPCPAVRMVLYDDGDGVAERAAGRATAMGYTNVAVLDGGAPSWAAAGHTLYRGVNVPSKVFGELVELAEHTPRLTADQVADMQRTGADMVILDGRPLAEYHKMNIPGALCCPNGELAARIGQIAPDPSTTIVINCAGRTRSIIGAQTLIDIGIPNPVFALENGTQGWTLSGNTLEHGNSAELAPISDTTGARADNVQKLMSKHGVERVSAQTLSKWLSDAGKTTFLLDVRTAEELASDDARRQTARDRFGIVHAPGGQLVQATDQWIGVRGARVVLLDNDGVRAPVIAAWLRRLGHAASVLQGGLDDLELVETTPVLSSDEQPTLKTLSPEALKERLGHVQIVDLRGSRDYRKAHIDGAIWSIRPRIGALAGALPCVLVCDDPAIAALAAKDLAENGANEILHLPTRSQAWDAEGLPIAETPNEPPDSERIDFLFFVHDRHDGNPDASRAYLEWETGLISQLDDVERSVFKI